VTRDRFRVGGSWGVTVVEYDADEPADPEGKRSSDRLLCLATSAVSAQRIAVYMNRTAEAFEAENR